MNYHSFEISTTRERRKSAPHLRSKGEKVLNSASESFFEKNINLEVTENKIGTTAST